MVDHFSNHFREHFDNHPRLDGVSFRTIFEEDNDNLTAPFLLSEIDCEIALYDGNKSPGPYGLNLFFFKASSHKGFWSDVFRFPSVFYSSLQFSSFFMALIPKVGSHSHLGDFRPISLVGSLYNIISKVLVSWLSSVMDKLIPTIHSTFLKGRLLVDEVIIVNELVDLVKWGNHSHLLFKVDFDKDYDFVSWSFLNYMLSRFVFNDK